MIEAPIQIRRPELTAQIRELAVLTGQSITDALAEAVHARLGTEKARAETAAARKKRAVDAALRAAWRLKPVGPRLTDADLYDENGLPK